MRIVGFLAHQVMSCGGTDTPQGCMPHGDLQQQYLGSGICSTMQMK